MRYPVLDTPLSLDSEKLHDLFRWTSSLVSSVQCASGRRIRPSPVLEPYARFREVAVRNATKRQVIDEAKPKVLRTVRGLPCPCEVPFATSMNTSISLHIVNDNTNPFIPAQYAIPRKRDIAPTHGCHNRWYPRAKLCITSQRCGSLEDRIEAPTRNPVDKQPDQNTLTEQADARLHRCAWKKQ